MTTETQGIMPANLADRWPLPEAEAVERELKEALAGLNRAVVVLDDDPTGVQTVHDLYVYTDWSAQTLAQGLSSGAPMFFVLTNSRGFTAPETRKAHWEIGENLARASRETGRPFLLVSRGDSTLRGHYPLETETLRQVLEERTGIRYDGEIIMPYFREGGRLTIGDIHYVRMGEELVPAGQTEFARDTAFAYATSDLKQWCQERTGGRYPAEQTVSVSLEELRARDYDGIARKLMGVAGFGKVVVNAAHDLDAAVFVTALLRAIGAGKEFLFRSAAGLVRILGGVEHRALLTRAELRPANTQNGGLVVVGSHVKKTTDQLERLLEGVPDLEAICFQADSALRPGGLEEERRRVLDRAEDAIRRGRTAVVYTSRQVLRADSDRADENLTLSVRISQALTGVVSDLSIRPAFIVAKGGITSSDVGIKALGVKRALVLGQAAPGIPVWRTGPESKFPNLSYVIFPGNVGEETTLRDLVRTLV